MSQAIQREEIHKVIRIRNELGQMYNKGNIEYEKLELINEFLQDVESSPKEYKIEENAIVCKDGKSNLLIGKGESEHMGVMFIEY